MAYEQIRPFYPKDMGKQKGWCLQNCRLGFRIYTPKYASAKAAMTAAKRNGTFKTMNELPTNCSVPVYTTSPSKNGHVVVYDKGVYYTDGRKYTPAANTLLGWDTMMDGTQVVKFTNAKGFLPAKGYWCEGDVDERIGKLASFMYRNFPSYTNKKALGNIYGKFLKASITEFQRRVHLFPDGMVGAKTYAELKKYGFNY